MISTLGRVLTVFITLASVAFMAFAISRWATVPDRITEARQMDDFRLTLTEGETPTWTAATRRTQDPVASSSNPSEVLTAMYQRAAQDAQAELTQYNEEIPPLEADIQEEQAAIVEDEAGVKQRVENLNDAANQQIEQIKTVTASSELAKAEAQKLQAERERRRGDTFRIREQLGELKADQFRAEQLQAQLTDMIRRIQGSLAKLQTRNEQLKQSAN